MAKATVPTTDTAESRLHIDQAAYLLEEIANLAANADRAVYFGPLPHEEFVGARDAAGAAERVQLHIDGLRAALCRIGWLADLGADKLGRGQVRGDAVDWLVSPMYPKDVPEVSHG